MARERKAEIELEKLTHRFTDPSDMTVAEFIEKWAPVRAKVHWTFNTYELYQTFYMNHIAPHLGHMRLQAVTPQIIDLFYDDLRTKRVSGSRAYRIAEEEIPFLSPSTIRHIHTILVPALKKAKAWKLIRDSPVTCDPPARRISKGKIWTAPQVANLRLGVGPREHMSRVDATPSMVRYMVTYSNFFSTTFTIR